MHTDNHAEIVKMNSTDSVETSNHEDFICVEGISKDLCEKPELFPVVDSLKELKTKFVQDVRNVSARYGLEGTVQIVFSMYYQDQRSIIKEI